MHKIWVVAFFPRAFERRVLLIVGVCYCIFTSSNRHICTSSHTFSLILSSSYLLPFSSSHLTSAHLHIFFFLSLSLSPSPSPSPFPSPSPSCPLALCHGLSPFFLFSLKAAGGADEAPRNGNRFARNEVRVSKTEIRLCKIAILHSLGHEVRVSKTDVFLRVWLVRRQPFRTK